MPRPEIHFWGFLPTGEASCSCSRPEGSFRQHPECVISFYQPVIPDITGTTAQLARALRLLFGRFESEFVGFQNLRKRSVLTLLPYLLSPIGDRMQFTKINKSRHAPTLCTYIWCLSPWYRKPILGVSASRFLRSVCGRGLQKILVRN